MIYSEENKQVEYVLVECDGRVVWRRSIAVIDVLGRVVEITYEDVDEGFPVLRR